MAKELIYALVFFSSMPMAVARAGLDSADFQAMGEIAKAAAETSSDIESCGLKASSIVRREMLKSLRSCNASETQESYLSGVFDASFRSRKEAVSSQGHSCPGDSNSSLSKVIEAVSDAKNSCSQ